MKRFYVSMTWDDWPEGGSYGTVVDAEDYEQAEALCRQEMAEARTGPFKDGSDLEELEMAEPKYWLENYGDEWEVVDCFDLDEFINQHRRKDGVQDT